MPLALVRISDNKVQTIIRDDVPDGWQPAEGFKAIPSSELPANFEYIEQEQKAVEEVAMWRVRAIVSVMGLATQVDQLLTTLPEPNKSIATVAWNYGNTVHRDSNTVKFLQSGLGLTHYQVDDIFIQAEAINV